MEGDVRHRRDNAGYRYRERKPTIAEAAAYEIARRDVIVFMADVPDTRENQEQDRICNNRQRYGEECDAASAEGERWYGNESVGGLDIAT